MVNASSVLFEFCVHHKVNECRLTFLTLSLYCAIKSSISFLQKVKTVIMKKRKISSCWHDNECRCKEGMMYFLYYPQQQKFSSTISLYAVCRISTGMMQFTVPGLVTFLAISKCTNTLNWKYSVYIIAVYWLLRFFIHLWIQ